MKKLTLLFLGVLWGVFSVSAQECTANEVLLNLETNAWGNEIGFSIADAEGNVVFSLDSMNVVLDNYSNYEFTLCLEDGCYGITLTDSFGDGWNGGVLTASFGEEMAQYGLDAGSVGYYSLGLNDPDCVVEIEGCTDPEALNYEPWATSDDGSCEYPFSCEDGVAATLYVCTFGNGGAVNIDIVDPDGNVVISVSGLGNVAVEYFEICLQEGVCYEVVMTNSWGETGWYGGYYWITTSEGQISNDELDQDLETETALVSVDNSCPNPGCTDPDALNYNPEANEDDGSCEYPEPCDDTTVIATFAAGAWASESSWAIYDSNAVLVYESVGGYVNYQTSTEALCLGDGCYTVVMYDSFGDGWNGGALTLTANGVDLFFGGLDGGNIGSGVFGVNTEECSDTDDMFGCMDPEALNYDENASIDDGSCEYPVYGCTDPAANNYNPWATDDDGSCTYPLDCGDATLASLYVCTFSNGDEVSLTITDDQGNEVISVSDLGNVAIEYFDLCLEEGICYTVNMTNSAGNTGWSGGYYWINVDGVQVSNDQLDQDLTDETANFSIDGSCPEEVVEGCTDPTALNYDAAATVDDGSCVYPEPCDNIEAIVLITTGSFGNEVSWEIIDGDGAFVGSGSGYSSNSAYTSVICVTDGCYTLEMFDSFGDGWNGATITIMIGNDIVLSTGMEQGDYEAVDFEVGAGCDPEGLYEGPMYSLTDQETAVELMILPNPVIDQAQIRMTELDPESHVIIEVRDITGRLVIAEDLGAERTMINQTLNLEQCAAGVHFITVVNGADRHTIRVIKQ